MGYHLGSYVNLPVMKSDTMLAVLLSLIGVNLLLGLDLWYILSLTIGQSRHYVLAILLGEIRFHSDLTS